MTLFMVFLQRILLTVLGEKRGTTEILESVLSRQLDGIEATMVHDGYRIKDLVDQFDAKPAEIKALFNNKLDPKRATELRTRCYRQGCRYEKMNCK